MGGDVHAATWPSTTAGGWLELFVGCTMTSSIRWSRRRTRATEVQEQHEETSTPPWFWSGVHHRHYTDNASSGCVEAGMCPRSHSRSALRVMTSADCAGAAADQVETDDHNDTTDSESRINVSG